MQIKIKRLTNTSRIPTKAHSSDACFDIYADCPNNRFISWDQEEINGVKIMPHSQHIFNTGFCTEIPEGYYCPVYARSGLGIKENLRPSNCVGIIDSSYRGEWKVALYNDSNEVKIIKHGDRVAQFAVLPVLECSLIETDTLTETERGEGGFGSSGK